jgi:chloramphenicol 3-O phosphotransferase
VTGSGLPGQIVILNGAPRSGKSSIAAAIQETFDGAWMNLGVDVARAMTAPKLQPGVGLRPGELDHAATPVMAVLYAAMWESVAAHARLGLDVVVDVGLYDSTVAADAARRLGGVPVLFVGVLCDVEVIMERRRLAGAARYVVGSESDLVPEPVLRWQREVHAHWTYDLEVDTSGTSPQECASTIGRRLDQGPPGDAFARLAINGTTA